MHWGADGGLRIGAFTTIAAIAADAARRRGLSGHCCVRARSRDAADPSSRHARRQSRATFALLVFSQSAYRLPEERRHRIARRDRAIISITSPSISAPASRRIPRPWRRRCWPMKRRSTTDREAALTIGDLLGDGSDGSADNALQPGEMIRSVELPSPLQGERALYKRAISRTPCRMAAGRSLRPRRDQGRRVPVHPPHRRRHRAGAAAPRGRGSRAAGQAAPMSATIAVAAEQAASGAKPLPMTGYKLDLLKGVVRDLLERLAGIDQRMLCPSEWGMSSRARQCI